MMICRHHRECLVGIYPWLVCRQRKQAMPIDEAEVYCKTCPSREDA